MAYGIDQAHKLGKNRKRLENTTDPSKLPSTLSYSYNRLNENTGSNTNSVLPQGFDTSIQTHHGCTFDASVGINYFA